MDSVISWFIACILSCGGLIWCLVKAAEEKARYRKEQSEIETHFTTLIR